MRRRAFLGGSAALISAPVFGARADTVPSGDAGGPADLSRLARDMAQRPYQPSRAPLPPPFAGLSYDAYRGIRPIPGRAGGLATGRGFVADLLPPGLYFPDPVEIEIASDDGFRKVPFTPDLFSFEPRYFDAIPDTAPGAGFSGLRLRHALNAPDVMDEVMVVQGASYFRAIGRAMAYGLSARALALGTGGPGPEEFPRFTHLRLHAGQGDSIRMEGVIDSPALAAYLDMTLHPGGDTRMGLDITLHPRRDIDDIGVAPLTSMFLKGPMRAAVSDDFRPRVHDSDVLYIENGAGEQLWRPIANPARIETSAFVDDAPVSFGLFQSARRFDDFQDTEARYHDRPSAIVRPRGDWGRGAVMLVEIPTDTEFMDNIVAFWRPDAPLRSGGAYAFSYDLEWTVSAPDHGQPVRIVQSRSGREHAREGVRRFVIDIAGGADDLTPDIAASDEAQIEGIALFALPGERGMRLTFLMAPQDRDAVDLRVVLRDGGGRSVGPVWLHRWTRARDGGV